MNRRRATRHRGMTLIELLVVLGLMAAIATVALTTLDSMGDRTRADTSRNRLDMIEEAIVGDGLDAGRFVSDMGRLPVVWSDIDGSRLSELWLPGIPDDTSDDVNDPYDTPAIVGFGHNTLELKIWNDVYVDDNTKDLWFNDDGDSDGYGDHLVVTLECGWRGPYIQVAGSALYDGFGNGFELTTEEEWEPVEALRLWPDQSIREVASLGRDAEFEGTANAEDGWENSDDIRDVVGHLVSSTLHVQVLVRDESASSGAVWVAPTATITLPSVWDDEHVYDQDELILENVGTNDDELFRCVTATGGKESGTTEPTWVVGGALVSDNELRWRHLERSNLMNRMRVTVFSPFTLPWSPSGSDECVEIRRTTATWDDGAGDPDPIDMAGSKDLLAIYNSATDEMQAGPVQVAWSRIGEVTFTGLTPGTRKLYAYGALVIDESQSNVANAYCSGLQTIELKPGTNHITVYLNETL